MKGEFFKNATQNFNHGNFECNYPVSMDGFQDLLFKIHSGPLLVNPRANPVFFGTAFSPVPTAIRHSLFRVLISSMPARGGQQHHSPFAISCFDFLNTSQNFLNERNVYSSRDKQHHSSFTICFLGKWMRQGLGVDITIRHSLFLILQLGCPVHAPFIQ